MNSQLRFVMHPHDERDFAARLLADASILLIDGPRWLAPEPETHRSLAAIEGSHCLIWSPQDRAALDARRLPSGDAWYCDTESFTIQFLRSQVLGSSISEGRLAISTSGRPGELGVERRFTALVRDIKKTYTNSIIAWLNPDLPLAPAAKGRSANPGQPDGQVWLGPNALAWLQADGLRRARPFAGSRVEGRLVKAAGHAPARA